MDGRSTFLHRARVRASETAAIGRAGFWTPPSGEVGETRPAGEAIGELRPKAVPENPSAPQPARARTANRHRWAGRAYRGDRANRGQGTRQNCPVTSGEGAPARAGRSEEAQATVYQKHRTLLKARADV